MLLNAANLAGVVVGYLLFMRLSPPARMLQRGASSMYLFGICVRRRRYRLEGAAASQWLFGRPYLTSLALWFSSEFTNYVTLMPFILVFPADWRHRLARGLRHVDTAQPMAAGGETGGVGAAGAGGGLQRADRRPRRGDLPDAGAAVAGDVLFAVQHHDRGAGLRAVVPSGDRFRLLSTTLDMKVLQNAVSMRPASRCWRWGRSPSPA